MKEIRKFLRKNKIDILHSKQTLPQGYVAAKLKREFKIPLYQTIQNPLAYKEEMVIRGGFMKIFSRLWLMLAERWVKFAMKNTDICGCVSTYSEGKAIMLGAKKTMIVPNGVDTEIFHPAAQGHGVFLAQSNKSFCDSKTPYGIVDGYKVVTTSTLIPRNGIDTLIRAFSKVATEFPEATLAIAGEGPMEDELRSLAKTLGVANSVKFLGTLAHKDIPGLLRGSNLFVRPSRFEGFGVSFIEAMACGIPVITCPSGGIKDFVVDGETGIFVEPDQPDSLANAIISVFTDRGKLLNLKRNALAMVRERYGWEKIVDKVEEGYGGR
ncbi:MAG: Glycosyl transferase group 1 [Candidatus Peregrinibacteria bacterium GW2011_GWA2_43_8]|nr:MAG: Glycosyl transferase group 1 [Candidatus Peregrinibacteria bacterium GW2011_GWA2_43_8]